MFNAGTYLSSVDKYRDRSRGFPFCWTQYVADQQRPFISPWAHPRFLLFFSPRNSTVEHAAYIRTGSVRYIYIYIYIHFVIRTYQLNIWKVIDHEFRGSIFKYSKLNHEYPIAKESNHSIDAQRNISGQWHTGFFIFYIYLVKAELCPVWILMALFVPGGSYIMFTCVCYSYCKVFFYKIY